MIFDNLIKAAAHKRLLLLINKWISKVQKS